MDSGCPDPDSDLEEFDFTIPVSAAEVIWLMDELMYREVQSSTPMIDVHLIISRSPGTRVIHFPRLCSLLFTWSDFSGRNQKPFRMPNSRGTVRVLKSMPPFLQSF